ncbi:MAG: hypothetical protein RLZZ114_434, partial [Bacteroidota bacterium]
MLFWALLNRWWLRIQCGVQAVRTVQEDPQGGAQKCRTNNQRGRMRRLVRESVFLSWAEFGNQQGQAVVCEVCSHGNPKLPRLNVGQSQKKAGPQQKGQLAQT